MYSYEKEDYEKVKLDIIIEEGKPKYKMVKAENEKFIKKYVYVNNMAKKGLKKNAIRRKISHSDYRDVIFHNKMTHHQMKSIRSKLHQISIYHLNKVSLSPFDDKRYILSDGITCYAYGHKNSGGYGGLHPSKN